MEAGDGRLWQWRDNCEIASLITWKHRHQQCSIARHAARASYYNTPWTWTVWTRVSNEGWNCDTSFCVDSVDRVGRTQGPVTVLVRWLVLGSCPALGVPRSSVTIGGEREQGQIVISDTAHWAQRGSWTPSHHAGCQGRGTPTRRLANPQQSNSAV